MRVTWNAINALLQSDWSAQHSGLGHENLSRVPRRIFPRGFPRPLVIRACVHVGKIRLARDTMSVCLSVKSHLTYGASVRPENAVTYSAGNEGQNVCGDLPETTAFKSYAAKHERISQYANYSDLPMSAFSA